MCDTHEVVIHNVGKVIRRKPVTFHDDEVVLGKLFLIQAIDNVANRDRRRAASKTDSMGLTPGSSFIGLIGGNG